MVEAELGRPGGHLLERHVAERDADDADRPGRDHQPVMSFGPPPT